MFKDSKIYGLLLVISVVIGACSSETEEKPVAQVGDRMLYASSVSEIIPINSSREDSILLAKDYINKWVKEELLIQKADENLTYEQKDVSKELI